MTRETLKIRVGTVVGPGLPVRGAAGLTAANDIAPSPGCNEYRRPSGMKIMDRWTALAVERPAAGNLVPCAGHRATQRGRALRNVASQPLDA